MVLMMVSRQSELFSKEISDCSSTDDDNQSTPTLPQLMLAPPSNHAVVPTSSTISKSNTPTPSPSPIPISAGIHRKGLSPTSRENRSSNEGTSVSNCDDTGSEDHDDRYAGTRHDDEDEEEEEMFGLVRLDSYGISEKVICIPKVLIK